MGNEMQATSVKIPWYKWDDFSLVPQLKIRQADKYNNWSWHFNWLIFHFWSLDHAQFTLECGLDSRWGNHAMLSVGAILRYLRIYIALPIPFVGWVLRKMQRSTQQIREMELNYLEEKLKAVK